MKKLGVCSVALALFAFASTASAGGIGIGAFGGASVPLVQDDNGQGTMYGVRVPVSLVPRFHRVCRKVLTFQSAPTSPMSGTATARRSRVS